MQTNLRSLLSDEQGNLSSARCSMWIVLITTLALITLDALLSITISNASYSLLGTLCVALIAWAGGPRAMQYLGPQISRVASAIGSARNDPSLPNRFKDDER